VTIAQLLRHGRVRRARFGIAGQNLVPAAAHGAGRHGLAARQRCRPPAVERGGPASAPGRGRAISSSAFAGQPVAGFDDLHRLLTEERLG
jgi:S1-C subfamily serine protease